ncbi:hypothetical protein [Streptomyces sp. ODS28]|uniref:hypothetical protein n=1 Tax=Streptomyces sp. ODS28 TaxID=3136688 RepID=UPI0031EEE7DE
MRVSVRTAAAVAAAALIPVLAAPAASAATESGTPQTRSSFDCPHDGRITPGDTCTELDNGVLVLHASNDPHDKPHTGIDVEYYKESGGKVKGKLGYRRAGANHWGKTRTFTSVTASQQWNPKRSCKAIAGILHAGGKTFRTPAVKPCH